MTFGRRILVLQIRSVARSSNLPPVSPEAPESREFSSDPLIDPIATRFNPEIPAALQPPTTTKRLVARRPSDPRLPSPPKNPRSSSPNRSLPPPSSRLAYRRVMENSTKLPVNGKHKLILKGLTGIASVVGTAYGYYRFNYATSLSGTYKVAAPRPKMIHRLDQVDICRNYIRLFEKCNGGRYICDVDCRPQLEKLCGINADDIKKNIDARFL